MSASPGGEAGAGGRDDTARPAAPPGHQEAWQRALEAAASLYTSTGTLIADQEQTLALLDRGLRDVGQRRRVLLLLSYLPADFTTELARVLVEIALSHRDALLVRQLFGRLRRDQAEAAVPAAVRDLLGEDEDAEEYRRMAELLYHLGLTGELRRLSARALASRDPDMRDVGAEYAPDEDEAARD